MACIAWFWEYLSVGIVILGDIVTEDSVLRNICLKLRNILEITNLRILIWLADYMALNYNLAVLKNSFDIWK